MVEREAEELWDCLNWKGRVDVLRKLDLRANLFNRDWGKLPSPVRMLVHRHWNSSNQMEVKNGEVQS